ncbi:MAG: undecaprenyl-diphosphate phosphatase [Bacteroidetes bacterium]|nr:undecaprenyl-diphosphate phosphatase [Bacteroidota bacterium]MBT5528545.1 undecaprenyl-diphosphate phosphatase [Cytophagia bacterium]MBT3421406.1 undecaprenyl-diphosphate phosphatase [Bacteroidota bacterium]MBT3800195.1 undecaprenyl-diphosphate phosphatase [Bacteroidota bacterium]MBT3935777.1 undecaprenyl-diphosphate phosphatase [Bacteroidota bacterium]
MDWIQALILGLVQGLTEFLPVSSSGHIELGKALMGVDAERSLTFTIVVHGATVLSTIVVFRKDLIDIFKGLFKFKWNSETDYTTKIILSMIPAILVGLFLEDQLKPFFEGNVLLVGIFLLVTAGLLAITYYAPKTTKDINYPKALLIGLAQAAAVIPGISRSGATIATGLLAGIDKEKITKFSFLMVLIPIIGKNLLEMFSGELTSGAGIDPMALLVGFIAAFASGLVACKLMIGIVKKGKLIYFAAYCLVIGLIAILFGLI